MQHFEVGGDRWYGAAGDRITAASRLGRGDRIVAIANDFLEAAEGRAARGPQVSAIARAASRLYLVGRYDEASLLLARLPDDLSHFRESSPEVVGHILAARANRALCDGDPGDYLEHCAEAARCFELAGDLRSASMTRVNIGFACAELGDYGAAESALRGVLEVSERLELVSVTALAQNNLGNVLTHLGRLDEAWDLELIAIETFALQGDERLASSSRIYLSRIHERRGHFDAAEREAREAAARTRDIPTVQMQALTQLASSLLRLGRAAEALAAAREAISLHDGPPRPGRGGRVSAAAHPRRGAQRVRL